ncbi:MAG TPA: D-glycero-beta-D-manno-heptose 1-phosphate adenylyltransferase [Alphaproteobacteria bacterium]
MTELANLAGDVERLGAVRVLCVGDLMLDRYVYGTVERMSPEGPAPVMRIVAEATMLGGAGNVVRNLVSLGARCTFVSVIGGDPVGRELEALLTSSPAVEPHLLVDSEHGSIVKSRYVADGQQLLRADRDPLAPLPSQVTAEVSRLAAEAVPACDAVVLSDYGKGVLDGPVVQAVVECARRCARPVVVDPKGLDFNRYRGADVLTPNWLELGAEAGAKIDDDTSAVVAARRVIQRCGIQRVLVTRGRNGMSLVDFSHTEHIPAHTQEVLDMSGAGDTVAATFTAAIAAGIDMLDAARLANFAAGIVVGKVGTAAVKADELRQALRHGSVRAADTKVLAMEPAAKRIAMWRRQGQKIGFTNGCFDLLHPGHISLLRQARAACDRLVVGLNSDASVARIKGPGRPIQPEAARAMLLAALEHIDLVVVFEDDTPMRLLRLFRPDVLVKGADYLLSEVVGAEFVKSYGGDVLLAEITPGYSTTSTIERIAG